MELQEKKATLEFVVKAMENHIANIVVVVVRAIVALSISDSYNTGL